LLKVKVENGKSSIPIPDPLYLTLYGSKFAEVTVEEVEMISVEIQRELVEKYEEDSS